MTTVKIEQGQFNNIHESVQFLALDDDPGPVIIGDCNTIHENVKIVVGKNGFKMGDWNTIHNSVFIMNNVIIGHNCWIGQGSHLDGRGNLFIENGVTVGFNCNIWSHVARGALIDGCTLWGEGITVLRDDVWLVGDNIHVSPNVEIAEKSIILAHSVITADTKPRFTYAGNPAKRMRNLNYWKDPSDQVKLEMMLHWVDEFIEKWVDTRPLELDSSKSTIMLTDPHYDESLFFAFKDPEVKWGAKTTFFHLGEMTYTKRLTILEMEFYRFIKDYKARFIPV